MLVVPLRTFGMTRSWALRRAGDRLVSHSQRLCGFVSMQGTGASQVRHVDLAPGVELRLDELQQQADPEAIDGLLSAPSTQAWAGMSLPPATVLADLDLWLACRVTGEGQQFVVLAGEQTAIDAGVVAPAWRFGTPATLSKGGLCYRGELTWTDSRFDLGARAHGPDADAAARQMVEQMRAWVDAGTPSPVLHVLPAGTPDGDLPAGTVLDKRHSRLAITFTSEGKGREDHGRVRRDLRAGRDSGRRWGRRRLCQQHRRRVRLRQHWLERLHRQVGPAVSGPGVGRRRAPDLGGAS